MVSRATSMCWGLAGLFLVGLIGCNAPQHRAESGGQVSATNHTEGPTSQPASAQPAAAPQDEKSKQEAEEKAQKEAKEKAKKEVKDARERERKLVKLQRDLEMARMRLGKLKLDHEIGQLKRDETLTRTKIDLELARKKLQVHTEISVPNQIARAELNMKWAENGLLEATQELEQLELMYNDEQFADKTKEIVIDRARRQLERTKRDLELRRGEHKTLLEISIPMETKEQELGVQDKERALTNLERDENSGKIDRQLALMSSEAEVERLQYELSDLHEEIKDAAEKKAEEQKAAPARETASAGSTR